MRSAPINLRVGGYRFTRTSTPTPRALEGFFQSSFITISDTLQDFKMRSAENEGHPTTHGNTTQYAANAWAAHRATAYIGFNHNPPLAVTGYLSTGRVPWQVAVRPETPHGISRLATSCRLINRAQRNRRECGICGLRGYRCKSAHSHDKNEGHGSQDDPMKHASLAS